MANPQTRTEALAYQVTPRKLVYRGTPGVAVSIHSPPVTAASKLVHDDLPRQRTRRNLPPSPIASAIRSAYAGRLTQAELARQLGVAQNTISRWSTGEVEPRLDDIVAVETACKLPRGFLLRAAGYVEHDSTPEMAIAADHRLDDARRELLLAAYRAALKQSKRDKA
jgi:transcriptional regulator with XRE-family HTH domain